MDNVSCGKQSSVPEKRFWMAELCPSSAKLMGFLSSFLFKNVSEWVRTVLHSARTSTTVPLSPHSAHECFPSFPSYVRGGWGVGRVSYIALSRNKIRKGSSQFSSCNFPHVSSQFCPGAFCSKLSSFSSSALWRFWTSCLITILFT